MRDRQKLLVVNEFHPETIARLDDLYQTKKLWLVPEAEQADYVRDLGDTCEAVATASWATNALIYQLPALKIIACFGVGVDGINFNTTRSRHILVTNTPGVLDDAVADIALALVLATQRNLVVADAYARSGTWLNGPFPFGRSLAGKTLGILGLGNIGQAIVQRAVPFRLQIAYHNRRPKDRLPYTYFATPTGLARHSDILLCMLPGGDATRCLVNAEVLQALGPEGVFINVGRGSTVDDVALVEALRSGTIAGAGLDVYSNEPHVPQALTAMDNVVLLPHIGSATTETRRAMGQLVIDNLTAWSAGTTPPTPV
ncbi:MAG: 2-hydroxyacid dehydrogenase [Pseudohongiellaceae bacterium]